MYINSLKRYVCVEPSMRRRVKAIISWLVMLSFVRGSNSHPYYVLELSILHSYIDHNCLFIVVTLSRSAGASCIT